MSISYTTLQTIPANATVIILSNVTDINLTSNTAYFRLSIYDAVGSNHSNYGMGTAITSNDLPRTRQTLTYGFNFNSSSFSSNIYNTATFDLYETLQSNIGKYASIEYSTDAPDENLGRPLTNYQVIGTPFSSSPPPPIPGGNTASFLIGANTTVSFNTPQVIGSTATSIPITNFSGYSGNIFFKFVMSGGGSFVEFLYCNAVPTSSSINLQISNFYLSKISNGSVVPDIEEGPLDSSSFQSFGGYGRIDYSIDGYAYYGLGTPLYRGDPPMFTSIPPENTSTFLVEPIITYSTPSTLSISASTLDITNLVAVGLIQFLLRIKDPVDGGESGVYTYIKDFSGGNPSLNMTESDGTSESEGWYNPNYSFNTYFPHNVGKYASIEYSTDSGSTWRKIGTDISTISLPPIPVGNTATFLITGIPPPPPPCFLEGSQILCVVNGVETYLPVEQLRKGTLVKTLYGVKPLAYIGSAPIKNPGTSERISERLYKLSPSAYPELSQDLFLTGAHAILVNKITDIQRAALIKEMKRIFVTDKKYRLAACVDERAEPWASEGTYTIYHFALEHENRNMNYGVYANGLLVESCCISFLLKHSTMKLLA